MREGMDAPLTESGLEKLVERCERLSKGNVAIQRILLENAIINNWKNVYYPSGQEIEAASNDVREELKNLFGLE
jgi:cystathionine beta-lyase/cystathionine gamma-synthase